MTIDGDSATGFESCVVSDGNQTREADVVVFNQFESCVVSDGNQTRLQPSEYRVMFESCVILRNLQASRWGRVRGWGRLSGGEKWKF